ncbi:MAG: ABC transporter substrate-binding protein [Xenococcaceae cyanobacterium]
MLRGVAQAQDEINQAGGIDGIPLKVMIANDGDDLKTAKNIASQLGQNNEILGVVGHYYSSRTLAAGKIYEPNQLVAIALSSSTEIENFSDHVFRTSPGDNLTAQALAKHMFTRWGKNKVAIFYDPNSKYSMSLRTEFVRAVNRLGGQVVTQSDWSVDNFNPNHAVSKAIERGAEVLMLVPDNAQQIKQGLEVAKISQQRLKLLGGDVMYSPKTLELGAENVIDMVLGAFWHIDADLNSQFSLKSKKLWGAEVNWISAMAYDATKALIQALQLQSNPNRIGVKQVLSNSDFVASGASNSVSFLPSGNRAQPKIQLVKIFKERESKTGYSFEPISD